MTQCSCYHDDLNYVGKRGICWGTMEKDICSCGGDESKCDFYPELRERTKKRVNSSNTDNSNLVEVVRCKECQHYKTKFCSMDIWHKDITIYKAGPDDYCSRGVRNNDP